MITIQISYNSNFNQFLSIFISKPIFICLSFTEQPLRRRTFVPPSHWTNLTSKLSSFFRKKTKPLLCKQYIYIFLFCLLFTTIFCFISTESPGRTARWRCCSWAPSTRPCWPWSKCIITSCPSRTICASASRNRTSKRSNQSLPASHDIARPWFAVDQTQ